MISEQSQIAIDYANVHKMKGNNGNPSGDVKRKHIITILYWECHKRGIPFHTKMVSKQFMDDVAAATGGQYFPDHAKRRNSKIVW